MTAGIYPTQYMFQIKSHELDLETDLHVGLMGSPLGINKNGGMKEERTDSKSIELRSKFNK